MTIEKGLTQHDASQKLKSVGKNSIESQTVSSIKQIFFSQFPTVINGILVLAALFSYIIGNLLDGTFIVAIIVLNACLGFIQEYRAQKSLEKLKDYTAPIARVIRDGKETQILAENVVPEDIIILSEGARVPADGILLEVTHLEIDESILTGESLAVIKNPSDKIYSGTLVTKGRGIFQVTK